MNRVLEGTVTGELLNLSDFIVNNCDMLESDNPENTIVKWQDRMKPNIAVCAKLTVPVTYPRLIRKVVSSTLWANVDGEVSSLTVSTKWRYDYLANDRNALFMLRYFRSQFRDYRELGRQLILPYAVGSEPIIVETSNQLVLPKAEDITLF